MSKKQAVLVDAETLVRNVVESDFHQKIGDVNIGAVARRVARAIPAAKVRYKAGAQIKSRRSSDFHPD